MIGLGTRVNVEAIPASQLERYAYLIQKADFFEALKLVISPTYLKNIKPFYD